MRSLWRAIADALLRPVRFPPTRIPPAGVARLSARKGDDELRYQGADHPDSGRAQAAFDHVFRLFQCQLDAVRRDRSLTPCQRAAAIAALKLRQSTEAKVARDRVLDDERQVLRAARRLAKALIPKPPML